MTVKQLADELGIEYVDYLPDMDDAFIGFTTDDRAVYDVEIMIQILMARDGMEGCDAVEFVDYNYIGFANDTYGPLYVNRYNLQ